MNRIHAHSQATAAAATAQHAIVDGGEAPQMSKKLTHVNRPGGVTTLLSSLEFKYAFLAQVVSAYINTRAKWPQRNPSHETLVALFVSFVVLLFDTSV